MEDSTAIQVQETGIEIAKVQEVLKSAPDILTKNKSSLSNAVKAVDALIQNSVEVGMSDTLDQQLASIINKCKTTVRTLNENRKPFTQIVDTIKKEFTGIEAELNKKVDEAQAIRNAYATQKMEEQRKKEQEVKAKLAKESEAIELQKQAKTKLAESFTEHLRESKQVLHDKLNEYDLLTIGEAGADLSQYNEELTIETYATFRPLLSASYHSAEEIKAITSAAMNGIFKGHKAQYQAEIAALKQDLKDKLPSRRNELERMAEADQEEKERLQKEQAKREADDKKQLEDEAKAKQAAEVAKATIEAAGAKAAVMVDTQVELGGSPAEQVKESYEIIVKNVAGYLLIAQLWFEHEGKDMTAEKIEKVTFARMKKYCETYAIKEGEIIENPSLEYKPIYKAK